MRRSKFRGGGDRKRTVTNGGTYCGQHSDSNAVQGGNKKKRSRVWRINGDTESRLEAPQAKIYGSKDALVVRHEQVVADNAGIRADVESCCDRGGAIEGYIVPAPHAPVEVGRMNTPLWGWRVGFGLQTAQEVYLRYIDMKSLATTYVASEIIGSNVIMR